MKKGFTLIELIAVIAILGMIAMIAIPNVLDIYNRKKYELYGRTVVEIERVCQIYLIDHPDLYDELNVDGDHVYVDLDVFCENKYLDCPLRDPRDNSEMKGYISYRKDDGEKYHCSFART